MRESTQVSLVSRLSNKIRRARKKIARVEVRDCEDADLVIMAYGSVSRTVEATLKLARENGLKVGMFRPITLWPFPGPLLREASLTAKHVLVVEMNMGQMFREAQRVIGIEKALFYGRPTGEPYRPKELLEIISQILKNDSPQNKNMGGAF